MLGIREIGVNTAVFDLTKFRIEIREYFLWSLIKYIKPVASEKTRKLLFGFSYILFLAKFALAEMDYVITFSEVSMIWKLSLVELL